MNRRNFLKMLGGAVAGVLVGCKKDEDTVDPLMQPAKVFEESQGSEERFMTGWPHDGSYKPYLINCQYGDPDITLDVDFTLPEAGWYLTPWGFMS